MEGETEELWEVGVIDGDGFCREICETFVWVVFVKVGFFGGCVLRRCVVEAAVFVDLAAGTGAAVDCRR